MTDNRKILPLISDSYKYSHYLQYPPGSEYVTSYIEARGWDDKLFIDQPEIVTLGIDWFIDDYLRDPITHADVDLALKLTKMHGVPFEEAGWRWIVDMHQGRLPVVIQALPDGTVVRPGIPMVQVTNTDPYLPWLTSFIETALLRAVWYPTTVATVSREVKKIIVRHLEVTGDPSLIGFKLHDFGARGASSHETAMIGGAAHLVNFMGTDTFEAIPYLYDKYGDVFGFSIPASEHSTITSWGRDGERDAFKNMLVQFGKGGLVACVSDSYDLYNAIEKYWGEDLKQDVLDMNATLVVRPDSGDPVEVTLNVIELLGEKFGYTTNRKGYKVLNPKVRMIQGDGVNLRSIAAILQNFKDHGWSADNIAFGMGAALLQKVNRDTLKFAMKADEIIVNGEVRPVYKDPATDPGKASKKGSQAVYFKNGQLHAIDHAHFDPEEHGRNFLEVAYHDGEARENNFAEIRKNAAIY